MLQYLRNRRSVLVNIISYNHKFHSPDFWNVCDPRVTGDPSNSTHGSLRHWTITPMLTHSVERCLVLFSETSISVMVDPPRFVAEVVRFNRGVPIQHTLRFCTLDPLRHSTITRSRDHILHANVKVIFEPILCIIG